MIALFTCWHFAIFHMRKADTNYYLLNYAPCCIDLGTIQTINYWYYRRNITHVVTGISYFKGNKCAN